jgi:peptidoglycan/LPS O-acetylase OafA/YrhL
MFSIAEILSVLLLIGFMVYAVRGDVNLLWRYDLYYLIPMAFILTVFQFEKGCLSRLFSSKPFVFLGELSFSFYMSHQLVLVRVVSLFGGKINSIGLAFGYAFLSLTVTLAIAAVMYFLIERPLNRYLRTVWDSHLLPYTMRVWEFISK